MAKQPSNQDDLKDAPFPYAGISLVQPSYLKGNPGTTEVAENVVLFEPTTGRARGGSRSGLTKFIDDYVSSKDHYIQHIGSIVTVSGELIDFSFGVESQMFPGVYAGIGFIDFDFVPLSFPDFGTVDGVAFSSASGYPPEGARLDKNQKIKITLTTTAHVDYPDGVPPGTPVVVTANLTKRDGNPLDPEVLAGKRVTWYTDPPDSNEDGHAGAAAATININPVENTAKLVRYTAKVTSVNGVSATSNTAKVRWSPIMTSITWANPAPITVGTALSATQLNASVGPGFPVGMKVYTPPSGTVLALGNAQSLHVDFVPTNPNAFSPSSGDVTIDVIPASGSPPFTALTNPLLTAYSGEESPWTAGWGDFQAVDSEDVEFTVSASDWDCILSIDEESDSQIALDDFTEIGITTGSMIWDDDSGTWYYYLSPF